MNSNDWTPYCGPGPTPVEWLSRWNLDPVLLAGLVGLLVLSVFLRGRRRWCAIGATALAVLIFVSPLCALSSALFTARTVHHLLLIGALAPLAAVALGLGSRRVGLATLFQTVAFWAWHAPAAYSWALSNDLAYWLMQASLIGASVWFWASVRSVSAPAGIAGLLATTVQMGLLGALIAFAGQPVYAPHLLTTSAWGLTPLEDQQVAGLLMWAPALGLYLGAALVKLNGLLASPSDRATPC